MEATNGFGSVGKSPEGAAAGRQPETDKDSKKKKETAKNAGATTPEVAAPKAIKWEGILFDRIAEEHKKPPVVASSPEAPIETPLAAERAVAEEIVADREQVVAQEIAAVVDTPEAVVAAADEELLTNIQDRLATAQQAGNNTESVTASIAEAYAETAQQIEHEPTPEVAIAQPVDQVEQTPLPVPVESNPVEMARTATDEAYQSVAAFEQPTFSPDRPIERAPEPEILVRRRGNPAIAAVLGFFVGRHNGRKRAEKRFAPIRRRLEKTVANLSQVIGNREAQIRDLQRDQLAVPPEAPRAPVEQVGRPEILTMPLPQAALERPIQPPVANSTEHLRPIVQTPEQTLTDVVPRVEQLAPAELLQLAERIMVDGVTVRSMYEVQRFDETSLRRIVAEYLRGGNVQQMVAAEVERHDRARYMRFETLNQAHLETPTLAAPTALPVMATVTHGSLPQPVAPVAVRPTTDKPLAISQQAAALTRIPAPTPPSLAERLMIIFSLVFIAVAFVLLIAVLTRR